MDNVGDGRAWNDPHPFGITLRPKTVNLQAGNQRAHPACRSRLTYGEEHADLPRGRPSEEGCLGCTCGLLRALRRAATDGLQAAAQALADRREERSRCCRHRDRPAAAAAAAFGSCFVASADRVAGGSIFSPYSNLRIESPTRSCTGVGEIALQPLVTRGIALGRSRSVEFPDFCGQGHVPNTLDTTASIPKRPTVDMQISGGSAVPAIAPVVTPFGNSGDAPGVSLTCSRQARPIAAGIPRSASCSVPRSGDSCSSGGGSGSSMSSVCSPPSCGPTPALSLSTANSFSSRGSAAATAAGSARHSECGSFAAAASSGGGEPVARSLYPALAGLGPVVAATTAAVAAGAKASVAGVSPWSPPPLPPLPPGLHSSRGAAGSPDATAAALAGVPSAGVSPGSPADGRCGVDEQGDNVPLLQRPVLTHCTR